MNPATVNMIRICLVDGEQRCKQIYELTLALKLYKLPFKLLDFIKLEGIDDSIKQTSETHWFRFKESPTNTSRLSLSLSRSALAPNLVRNIHI